MSDYQNNHIAKLADMENSSWLTQRRRQQQYLHLQRVSNSKGILVILEQSLY